MSLPLDINGGPLPSDLEPFDDVYSLTIKQASKRTGLSRSRIYRYLDDGRLRSFKVGKARLIIAQSLKQLLGELAATSEGVPSPPQQGGRFTSRAPKKQSQTRTRN